ncbi:hypothetical protein BJ166DRAFT_40139 [Pestalotiopsis sp. NC0098]|nr:hypothetical protein BJ166DRAFT_40139 [Pestalotiopsis sp. NC0098]
MLLKTLVGLLLTAAASASQHQQHHNAKRTNAPSTPTAASTFDSAKVSSQLQVLLGGMTVSALVPSPTVTLGVSIPADLRTEIMTAVPMDVLVKLMNPTYRESVASDFAAGNTPSWYQILNPELKTFFETIAKDIKTGSAVFTVSSTPTVTGTAEATEDSVASSSSSGLAAAPTGISRDMAASIIALAGAAGVALML